MSDDSINWEAAQALSEWLDNEVAPEFQEQPLAQDWARISKVSEEVGEAIEAFIGATGQNPRKGVTHSMDDVMTELADVALTGIYALIHFVGAGKAREVLTARQRRHNERIGLPFATAVTHDPVEAAAINRGWVNGLLELAVWCDQKAGDAQGPGPNVLRAVAQHARERAR